MHKYPLTRVLWDCHEVRGKPQRESIRGLIQNIFRTAGTNWDSSTSWYAMVIGITAVYISDAACDAYGENTRILKNYQKTYNIDTDAIGKGPVNTLLPLEGSHR